MDVQLVLIKSNGQQKAIPLPKSVTVLGRGTDSDLRIPIESCSRKQCQISLTGESLMLKDLGSSNGTYVNNQRIDETALNAGDRITIGPVVLTVQIDGKPASITESKADLTSSGPLDTQGADDDTIPLSDDSGIDLPGGGMDEDPISALEALADLEEEDEDK